MKTEPKSVLGRLNIRFAMILLIYGGAVFLVYRDEVLGPVLAPLSMDTARLVHTLLDALGIDTLREGAVITQPDVFSYEIAYECTGFLPITTFIVCVLAYPVSWRSKWVGMMLGISVLWLANLVRLLSLFYIGVHFPNVFVWAHEVAWEWLLAAIFISLWLGWMSWSVRRISPGKLLEG